MAMLNQITKINRKRSMQMSIKTKFINSNALKLLAVIAMVVDHASIWLVPDDTTLAIFARGFGRLAAPIIGYMIAEGYFYTSNKQKYLKRLFIFALISHFPFVMYFGLEWWQGTSVIWGLFMGLVALAISQTTYISRLIKVMIIALCCLLAWTADWNYILACGSSITSSAEISEDFSTSFIAGMDSFGIKLSTFVLSIQAVSKIMIISIAIINITLYFFSQIMIIYLLNI